MTLADGADSKAWRVKGQLGGGINQGARKASKDERWRYLGN